MTRLFAFLSYSHRDDSSFKEVSSFHECLQSELRAHLGEDVEIFFDKRSISWGTRWQEFIDGSLNNSAFFIPVLTPSFFTSPACREEYSKFAETEKKSGRRDLIKPIYYIRCKQIETKIAGDSVVDDVLTRQYRDWRHLRHHNINNDIMREFAQLALDITLTIEKMDGIPPNKEEALYYDTLLDKPLNFENLIAYTALRFANKPVSEQWTRRLLADIDKSRYKNIRDINTEVNVAQNEVDKYAATNPGAFRFATDYITKSLIFVDSDFRSVHSVSPRTMDAAMKAKITRHGAQ